MSEPVSSEIKTRKGSKAALFTSHCACDNTAPTFWFKIKQHSYKEHDEEHGGAGDLNLTPLYVFFFWRLHFDLNMIFIFHDNGDGDDDNAVCIVMIIGVPGVTGRVCAGMLHWCPPCWLWTLSCPLMSTWLMGRVFSWHFLSPLEYFYPLFSYLFQIPSLLELFYFLRVINLSVRLSPISPDLPAVSLCLLSFIRGSHQTLPPDWFSCEQGCSGGDFENHSHHVHRFSDNPSPHLHPLLCPGVEKMYTIPTI